MAPPTHYVVELTQDWFVTGLHGEREMSARAASRAKAAAGYSHDRLLNVIEAETAGPVRFIARRDGDEVAIGAGDTPDALDRRAVDGVFPVDGGGTRRVLE